jgi:hypothetical protein
MPGYGCHYHVAFSVEQLYFKLVYFVKLGEAFSLLCFEIKKIKINLVLNKF